MHSTAPYYTHTAVYVSHIVTGKTIKLIKQASLTCIHTTKMPHQRRPSTCPQTYSKMQNTTDWQRIKSNGRSWVEWPTGTLAWCRSAWLLWRGGFVLLRQLIQLLPHLLALFLLLLLSTVWTHNHVAVSGFGTRPRGSSTKGQVLAFAVKTWLLPWRLLSLSSYLSY